MQLLLPSAARTALLAARGRPPTPCHLPPCAGTFLDGIHSKVQLLVYDMLPVDLAQLHTSALVPPLLASFYVVLGGLVLWSDYRLGSDDSTQQAMRRGNSLLYLVASFGWVTIRRLAGLRSWAEPPGLPGEGSGRANCLIVLHLHSGVY
jgi:hypothetical protein